MQQAVCNVQELISVRANVRLRLPRSPIRASEVQQRTQISIDIELLSTRVTAAATNGGTIALITGGAFLAKCCNLRGSVQSN